jgi:hypothetical protein
LKSEKNDRVRQAAENVLRTEPERWLAGLLEAVTIEPSAGSLRQGNNAKLSPEFVASFQYFSDYVAPELNRPQRMDEMMSWRPWTRSARNRATGSTAISL